jgi:outer membrane murein-binding lipoprotein Lpp
MAGEVFVFDSTISLTRMCPLNGSTMCIMQVCLWHGVVEYNRTIGQGKASSSAGSSRSSKSAREAQLEEETQAAQEQARAAQEQARAAQE